MICNLTTKQNRPALGMCAGVLERMRIEIALGRRFSNAGVVAGTGAIQSSEAKDDKARQALHTVQGATTGIISDRLRR